MPQERTANEQLPQLIVEENNEPNEDGVSIASDVVPPDRSSSASAPPALQLSSESLFAFQVEHAKIFSDIRANEEYYDFYNNYNNEKDREKLPHPLEPSSFLFDSNLIEEEDMNMSCASSHFLGQISTSPSNSGGSSLCSSSTELPRLMNLSFSLESSKQLQELQFSQTETTNNTTTITSATGGIPIPSSHRVPTQNETLWAPLAKKPPINAEANLGSNDGSRQLSNHSNLRGPANAPSAVSAVASVATSLSPYAGDNVSLSSSPSAQTPFNTASFILRDEEQSGGHFASSSSGQQHSKMINLTQTYQARPARSGTQTNNGSSNVGIVDRDMHSDFSNRVESATKRRSGDGFDVHDNSTGSNLPTNGNGSNNNSSNSDNGNSIVSSSSVSLPVSPRPNVVCRYFASGYCSRGDKCFYSHAFESLTSSQKSSVHLSSSQQTFAGSLSLQQSPASDSSGKTPSSSGNSTNGKPNESKLRNGSSTTKGSKSQSSRNNINHGGSSTPGSFTTTTSITNNSGGSSSKSTSPSSSSSLSSSSSNSSTTISSSSSAFLSFSGPPPLLALSPRGFSVEDLSIPMISASSISGEFEQMIGRIHAYSKDQQGCRFLQKKLEENNDSVTQIIFSEVYDHIADLMIDPFGNYLCQKLLEHCSESQRFSIVQRISSDLVSISKNMHGTRAVQKLIECLSSSSQIDLVKRALQGDVVELIQDLNGNHVIQRCLHKLSPEDNQFIYDAVTTGKNCVQVATHRHGCCVLQRCIDHASEKQKVQLIQEISNNALELVQDPYGNYVVQYVLELPFPSLVENLARGFSNHIRQLATQKFSSNVIEKCLAVSNAETRSMIISEILSENNLLLMLQDPFANYVVQTALTVSDPKQHQQLVESIKPHLNQLRNTPYGKRIQSKIAKEGAERSGKRNSGGQQQQH